MTTANNPSLGSIPIRRGFYDSAADQGFGFDKAWNKHKSQKARKSSTR